MRDKEGGHWHPTQLTQSIHCLDAPGTYGNSREAKCDSFGETSMSCSLADIRANLSRSCEGIRR
jgi:hypothetical protein